MNILIVTQYFYPELFRINDFAQEFPSILEAAKILKNNKNIQWIILVGGRKEDWVKSEIKKIDWKIVFI